MSHVVRMPRLEQHEPTCDCNSTCVKKARKSCTNHKTHSRHLVFCAKARSNMPNETVIEHVFQVCRMLLGTFFQVHVFCHGMSYTSLKNHINVVSVIFKTSACWPWINIFGIEIVIKRFPLAQSSEATLLRMTRRTAQWNWRTRPARKKTLTSLTLDCGTRRCWAHRSCSAAKHLKLTSCHEHVSPESNETF